MVRPSDDDLIAVASGTAVKVAGWCKLLRARNVQYVTETSFTEPGDEAPDYVELWIHKGDAERARKILEQGDMGPYF